MPNQKHYLISENPTTSLKEALSKNGIDQKTIIGIDDFEVMECASFEKARNIFGKLIQPLGIDSSNSNYWYYMLLNEVGFREFKELRTTQEFKLQDLKNAAEVAINLSKLEVVVKEPFGGGVIKGKKKDFKSAFHFWVNSVTKITRENFEIDADLFGVSFGKLTKKAAHQ